MSAMRRPVTTASAPPRRRLTFSSSAIVPGVKHDRVGRRREVDDRAVEVEKEGVAARIEWWRGVLSITLHSLL